MPFLPTFQQLTNSTKKDSGDFLHHVCWLYYQRHLSQKWQQGRWIHLHIIRLTGNKLRFISSQIHLADFFSRALYRFPFPDMLHHLHSRFTLINWALPASKA